MKPGGSLRSNVEIRIEDPSLMKNIDVSKPSFQATRYPHPEKEFPFTYVNTPASLRISTKQDRTVLQQANETPEDQLRRLRGVIGVGGDSSAKPWETSPHHHHQHHGVPDYAATYSQPESKYLLVKSSNVGPGGGKHNRSTERQRAPMSGSTTPLSGSLSGGGMGDSSGGMQQFFLKSNSPGKEGQYEMEGRNTSNQRRLDEEGENDAGGLLSAETTTPALMRTRDAVQDVASGGAIIANSSKKDERGTGGSRGFFDSPRGKQKQHSPLRSTLSTLAAFPALKDSKFENVGADALGPFGEVPWTNSSHSLKKNAGLLPPKGGDRDPSPTSNNTHDDDGNDGGRKRNKSTTGGGGGNVSATTGQHRETMMDTSPERKKVLHTSSSASTSPARQKQGEPLSILARSPERLLPQQQQQRKVAQTVAAGDEVVAVVGLAPGSGKGDGRAKRSLPLTTENVKLYCTPEPVIVEENKEKAKQQEQPRQLADSPLRAAAQRIRMGNHGGGSPFRRDSTGAEGSSTTPLFDNDSSMAATFGGGGGEGNTCASLPSPLAATTGGCRGGAFAAMGKRGSLLANSDPMPMVIARRREEKNKANNCKVSEHLLPCDDGNKKKRSRTMDHWLTVEAEKYRDIVQPHSHRSSRAGSFRFRLTSVVSMVSGISAIGRRKSSVAQALLGQRRRRSSSGAGGSELGIGGDDEFDPELTSFAVDGQRRERSATPTTSPLAQMLNPFGSPRNNPANEGLSPFASSLVVNTGNETDEAVTSMRAPSPITIGSTGAGVAVASPTFGEGHQQHQNNNRPGSSSSPHRDKDNRPQSTSSAGAVAQDAFVKALSEACSKEPPQEWLRRLHPKRLRTTVSTDPAAAKRLSLGQGPNDIVISEDWSSPFGSGSWNAANNTFSSGTFASSSQRKSSLKPRLTSVGTSEDSIRPAAAFGASQQQQQQAQFFDTPAMPEMHTQAYSRWAEALYEEDRLLERKAPHVLKQTPAQSPPAIKLSAKGDYWTNKAAEKAAKQGDGNDPDATPSLRSSLSLDHLLGPALSGSRSGLLPRRMSKHRQQEEPVKSPLTPLLTPATHTISSSRKQVNFAGTTELLTSALNRKSLLSCFLGKQWNALYQEYMDKIYAMESMKSILTAYKQLLLLRRDFHQECKNFVTEEYARIVVHGVIENNSITYSLQTHLGESVPNTDESAATANQQQRRRTTALGNEGMTRGRRSSSVASTPTFENIAQVTSASVFGQATAGSSSGAKRKTTTSFEPSASFVQQKEEKGKEISGQLASHTSRYVLRLPGDSNATSTEENSLRATTLDGKSTAAAAASGNLLGQQEQGDDIINSVSVSSVEAPTPQPPPPVPPPRLDPKELSLEHNIQAGNEISIFEEQQQQQQQQQAGVDEEDPRASYSYESLTSTRHLHPLDTPLIASPEVLEAMTFQHKLAGAEVRAINCLLEHWMSGVDGSGLVEQLAASSSSSNQQNESGGEHEEQVNPRPLRFPLLCVLRFLGHTILCTASFPQDLAPVSAHAHCFDLKPIPTQTSPQKNSQQQQQASTDAEDQKTAGGKVSTSPLEKGLCPPMSAHPASPPKLSQLSVGKPDESKSKQSPSRGSSAQPSHRHSPGGKGVHTLSEDPAVIAKKEAQSRKAKCVSNAQKEVLRMSTEMNLSPFITLAPPEKDVSEEPNITSSSSCSFSSCTVPARCVFMSSRMQLQYSAQERCCYATACFSILPLLPPTTGYHPSIRLKPAVVRASPEALCGDAYLKVLPPACLQQSPLLLMDQQQGEKGNRRRSSAACTPLNSALREAAAEKSKGFTLDGSCTTGTANSIGRSGPSVVSVLEDPSNPTTTIEQEQQQQFKPPTAVALALFKALTESRATENIKAMRAFRRLQYKTMGSIIKKILEAKEVVRGAQLCSFLHEHGVNLCFLGPVCEQLENSYRGMRVLSMSHESSSKASALNRSQSKTNIKSPTSSASNKGLSSPERSITTPTNNATKSPPVSPSASPNRRFRVRPHRTENEEGGSDETKKNKEENDDLVASPRKEEEENRMKKQLDTIGKYITVVKEEMVVRAFRDVLHDAWREECMRVPPKEIQDAALKTATKYLALLFGPEGDSRTHTFWTQQLNPVLRKKFKYRLALTRTDVSIRTAVVRLEMLCGITVGEAPLDRVEENPILKVELRTTRACAVGDAIAVSPTVKGTILPPLCSLQRYYKCMGDQVGSNKTDQTSGAASSSQTSGTTPDKNQHQDSSGSPVSSVSSFPSSKQLKKSKSKGKGNSAVAAVMNMYSSLVTNSEEEGECLHLMEDVCSLLEAEVFLSHGGPLEEDDEEEVTGQIVSPEMRALHMQRSRLERIDGPSLRSTAEEEKKKKRDNIANSPAKSSSTAIPTTGSTSPVKSQHQNTPLTSIDPTLPLYRDISPSTVVAKYFAQNHQSVLHLEHRRAELLRACGDFFFSTCERTLLNIVRRLTNRVVPNTLMLPQVHQALGSLYLVEHRHGASLRHYREAVTAESSETHPSSLRNVPSLENAAVVAVDAGAVPSSVNQLESACIGILNHMYGMANSPAAQLLGVRVPLLHSVDGGKYYRQLLLSLKKKATEGNAQNNNKDKATEGTIGGVGQKQSTVTCSGDPAVAQEKCTVDAKAEMESRICVFISKLTHLSEMLANAYCIAKVFPPLDPVALALPTKPTVIPHDVSKLLMKNSTMPSAAGGSSSRPSLGMDGGSNTEAPGTPLVDGDRNRLSPRLDRSKHQQGKTGEAVRSTPDRAGGSIPPNLGNILEETSATISSVSSRPLLATHLHNLVVYHTARKNYTLAFRILQRLRELCKEMFLQKYQKASKASYQHTHAAASTQTAFSASGGVTEVGSNTPILEGAACSGTLLSSDAAAAGSDLIVFSYDPQVDDDEGYKKVKAKKEKEDAGGLYTDDDDDDDKDSDGEGLGSGACFDLGATQPLSQDLMNEVKLLLVDRDTEQCLRYWENAVMNCDEDLALLNHLSLKNPTPSAGD